MRLIPAIDLKGGCCVRLLKGDFAAETRYEVDPRELAARYRALGARWLHVVDLDGAREGGAGNRSLIGELAGQSGIRLQVGGGLREEGAAGAMLELGAARIVVGSAAVTASDRVRRWIGTFGAERVAVAFDVRIDQSGIPRVTTHGWLEQSQLALWDALERYGDAGLEHVLCTDVSRDGTLEGPNVELYAAAVRRFPHIAWQASGGIRDARDLSALAAAGASAAICGKALLENRLPIEEIAPFLPSA